MKRKAEDNAGLEPPAKAARMEVERVLPAGQERSERDKLLAALFEDEVEAGRWQLGTFEALHARYPPPKPEYKSARVTLTMPGIRGFTAVDSQILLPIQVAEFFDIMKPSAQRTRSKHDYVDLEWGEDIDWDFSESEPDDGPGVAAWRETARFDEWHDEIDDTAHGWAAFDYFMAHYEDADRDAKTRAILARK